MSESRDTEALKKDLDALRNDLRDLAESVRASGEKQARNGLDQACNTYEDLRKQAGKRGKEVGAEIETRPFTSVFTAFGIGLVLGKLIGR